MPTGIECSICSNRAVEPLVKLYNRGRFVGHFLSYLAAENYVMDNNIGPSTILFIYSCKDCGHEKQQLARFFDPEYK